MIRQILLLLAFSAMILLSYFMESATAVKPIAEGTFSALSVHPHIERIASEIHPIGSEANHRLRDYIIEEFEKLGLEVRVEKGNTAESWNNKWGRVAYVENIIATRKGTGGTKKVYVAGHYDSVFEGPGAADDGYAVASMLETARLLQGKQLKNDVVFLVTDGEEMGLLGAEYHVKQNTMEDAGVLLNFEARGNAGPGIAFEWSDDNAWLVREMKKVTQRPIANSLSYEVYKLMQNDSDVTEFKKRNVPVINHAFIDGFSYYHNPADNPENISKRSVQHTGENMYRQVLHFANYDFGPIEKGNASFFNFYGHLFTYPAKLDLLWLVLLLIGMGLVLFQVNKSNSIQIGKVMVTLFGAIAIALITMLVAFGLSQLVIKIYPEYSLFYAFHYYNYKWYLFAGIGLGMLVPWLMGSRLKAWAGEDAFQIALLLLLALMTTGFYLGMPTATYICLFPTLALTVYVFATKRGLNTSNHLIASLFVMVVFFGFWSFMIHNLYLAFSVLGLPGPLLFVSLITLVSIALFSDLGGKKGSLLPFAGTLLFLFSLVAAHLSRSPSQEAPLPSQLFYGYDQTSDVGYWGTTDQYLNAGHGPLLEEASSEELPSPLPFARFHQKASYKPLQLLANLRADSLENGQIRYIIKQPKRALRNILTLLKPEGVDSLVINGTTAMVFKGEEQEPFNVVLFGIGLDSMVVELRGAERLEELGIRLTTRIEGMPEEVELPPHVARRGGYTEVVTTFN